LYLRKVTKKKGLVCFPTNLSPKILSFIDLSEDKTCYHIGTCSLMHKKSIEKAQKLKEDTVTRLSCGPFCGSIFQGIHFFSKAFLIPCSSKFA